MTIRERVGKQSGDGGYAYTNDKYPQDASADGPLDRILSGIKSILDLLHDIFKTGYLVENLSEASLDAIHREAKRSNFWTACVAFVSIFVAYGVTQVLDIYWGTNIKHWLLGLPAVTGNLWNDMQIWLHSLK